MCTAKHPAQDQNLPSYQHTPSLSDLDGPFQLSEYLALKVRSDPHSVRSLVEVPRGDDESGGRGPEKNVVSGIHEDRAWL